MFKENDVISLRNAVVADVIGEQRKVLLPSGTTATIVLVHGDHEKPEAYEIEAFFFEEDCYVLATIEASDV